MINRSTDGKTRCLSISYGKDSLACLGAIEQLGLPLDRIIHAEVWATDTIPADLPEQYEFKKVADQIILERYGIQVEHYFATNSDGSKLTYDECFHRQFFNSHKYENGTIWGFPFQLGAWCNSRLKVCALNRAKRATQNVISYVGIALDEPKRLERMHNRGQISPLELIGWTEADAKQWCKDNGLLSPVYQRERERDGCWFCHNQGIKYLRKLRHEYPDLWQMLMQWDLESPFSFRADGHTVHDFDARFAEEDAGMLPPDKPFKWEMVGGELNFNLFNEM